MSLRVDLRAKPFYLDDEQIAWVEDTLSKMSLDDKIGQLFLFNSPAVETAEETIERLNKIGLRPNGFLLRGAASKEIREKIKGFQDYYEIPVFIAGDLDRGASNMIQDGTACGHQMEIGATGDPELAYKTGLICAKECAAVGTNWNFGPVIDIDFNPLNPITNVRSFGSNPDNVLKFARRIAQGMRDGGLIPCIKHWPGDGVDGRDQHFLASVNSLSMEEWDATYGKVYQGMIDDGMETLMSAHILLPSYARFYNPDVKDEDILPGSLNGDLHNKLLRGKMGFNGLIVTDATTMGGFTEVIPRSKAVPLSIANGADIFLFSRDMAEDFAYMKQGIEDGVLTLERLDDALTRVLGLKAKMHLHTKKANGTLVPPVEALEIFEKGEGRALAKEIADKGITLVKDTQKLLPLNPEKQKNIYMVVIGDKPGYHNARGDYAPLFVQKLEEKGFNVTVYDEEDQNAAIGKMPIEEFKKKYDVILYFCNIETSGSDSAARITWPGKRATVPQMIHDVPTMMVSIDNPYHLLDAPRIPTYINAYTSEDIVVETLAEKIAGESTFKGVSPVDAFVGLFNSNK
ncbi:MAG: glycoside hydrolase family 3 N-terminal domain-containing protein [Candidatus Faecivivens sp.]|nr:glycoside hydrolase family 3 protein [Oscillospiraceae bacterium]MDY2712682.1 glycoside hydrolase family 3 N-terminal domain-containing protein [Candidatus Faecivivens sp.]